MQEPLEVSAWIGGKRINTNDKVSRENPSNPEEIVGYAPCNTREEALAAIKVAAKSFNSWSQTELNLRVERLLAIADKLEQAIPELRVLLTRETGRAVRDSEGELRAAVARIRYACNVSRFIEEKEEIQDERGQLLIERRPYGVVGAITPWNAPVSLAIGKIAPAVVTGNTVVLKPSPLAPLTIGQVAQLFIEGLPEGVVNVVFGGADVGDELVRNPYVSKLTFTGGIDTAVQIARTSAPEIKNLTLELGGNDAAIFLEDADLSNETVMRLVIGCFFGTGQICMAVKRILVHESIYHQLVNAFVDLANDWIKVGDGLDPQTTVGPMNNLRQRDYVLELLDDARNNGGKVIPLGTILDHARFSRGYFVQPALVTGMKVDSRIVCEEQFGPAVPILPFRSTDEAMQMANNTSYGLTASIWCKDTELAYSLAKRLQVGYVFVNTHGPMALDLRVPFGGWKRSGIGVEGGVAGLMEFMQYQSINIPKVVAKPQN